MFDKATSTISAGMATSTTVDADKLVALPPIWPNALGVRTSLSALTLRDVRNIKYEKAKNGAAGVCRLPFDVGLWICRHSTSAPAVRTKARIVSISPVIRSSTTDCGVVGFSEFAMHEWYSSAD